MAAEEIKSKAADVGSIFNIDSVDLGETTGL